MGRSVWEFEGYTLDARERTLVRGATTVRLRRRTFDLLVALVSSSSRLVTRAELMERVWHDVVVSNDVVKVAVCELRSALGDDPRRPAFVETAGRDGYRFIAPVTRRRAGGRPASSATAVARATSRVRVRPRPRIAVDDRSGGALFGREPELALLHAAAERARVAYVHGIGGIGKTSLVAAFAASRAVRDDEVLRLDARDIACLPGDFLAAVAAARDGAGARARRRPADDDVLGALADGPGRAVLIVDAYEQLAPLDRWVREDLVPALPERVLLVLSGRLPPSAEWRGRPGWNDDLVPVAVGALPPDAARRLLRARGVAADHDEAALACAHGHPLTLCLVADLVARRPDAPFVLDRAPDVVQALLDRFVRDVDDRRQAALDACCVARRVNEPLLGAMIGPRDARELLRWLAGLSFVELGEGGVFPHDLARDVLLADLKWRNPERFTELVERANAYLADRLRGPQGASSRLADELLFLHSHHPVIGAFTPWRGADGLAVEPATVSDHAEIVAIVRRHEGARGAEIAARWLARQPGGALVVRDGGRGPAGFKLTIRLDGAAPSDVAADPVARATMEFLRAQGGVRRGRSILLHRFLMARDTYQDHSPIQSLLGSQCVRAYLTTPRLDWAFTCLNEPDKWVELLRVAFGAGVLPTVEYEGRRDGVFYQCFLERSPAAWLAWLASRGAPDEPGAVDQGLDREALAAEVRAALAQLHRRGGLDDVPLLAALAGRRATGARRRRSERDLVRGLLVRAVESLAREPRGDKLYVAVRHRYLEPAPTHRAAAERAGMPLGTYRRSLALAVERIVDRLTESRWR